MSANKALSVVTQCTTSEQFIERYHQFCDDTTIFVATKKAAPLGQELTFSIQLADRTAILRGAGSIEASFTSDANRWRQPGIKIRIRRLTANSTGVFAKLQLHAAVASIDDLGSESEPKTEPAFTPAPAVKVEAKPIAKIALTSATKVAREVVANVVHEPAAALAPASQRTPVVRFATGDEGHVITPPLDPADAEPGATEAPFVDLVECTIFEATSDVIDMDEEMIDLEPAPRRDETPLAVAVSADGRPSLHRVVSNPRVVVTIAAALLVVLAGIAALRIRGEQRTEPPNVRPAKAAPSRT